jgi:predicted TIM-barrel fold metal-dependent hydrolase
MGVERLVLSSHAAFSSDHKWGNRIASEACARHPGRLFAYAGVNPNYPAEVRSDLEWCFSREGFVGIKLHAATHEYRLEDSGYRAAWEWAAQHRVPVLVHFWNNSSRCGPGNVRRVASKYPDVRIVLAHLGGAGSDYRAVPPLAREHENLLFDTCGSRHCRGMVEELVAAGLADRLMYGSDMPFIDPGSQLGKIVYAEIPEDARTAILGGNARRLFGWEE